MTGGHVISAKAPTVYDVARRAGVSIATVSRCLQRPETVAPATREVVLAAIQDLGYLPSGSARTLAARRMGAIGLCFPDMDGLDNLAPIPADSTEVPEVRDALDVGGGQSSLYIAEVLRGVGLEAWRREDVVTTAVARGPHRRQVFDDLAGRVDGLVTLSRTVPDQLLARIARRIPVVVVAGPRSPDAYDHVNARNSEGMQALTTHLLRRHGVTRVLFVGGPADSPDSAERFAGFQAGMRAAGLPVPPTVSVRGNFTRESGREVGERLLQQPLPEAIVCANDQMAIGLMDVLDRAGVRVPADVLVTGFDGIEAGSLVHPRLTTVRQPMADLGRVAVQLVHSRLEQPTRSPATRMLPVSLVIRESCGC